MSKNNLLNHKLLSKTNIAVICTIGMIVGFFAGRAWLSFFTFAFGVISLWNIHPKRWLREKWWIAGALWVALYAVSYFWTMNEASWSARFQSKLPILLLPLAFVYILPFSKKQIQLFTGIAALVFVVSAAYSLSFFIKNPSFYSEQYIYSHVLPTFPENDHIRYSLSLALFIVWSVSVFQYLDQKWLKVFIALTIIFLSVYLHILAARTGLMVWYVFVLGWLIRFTFKRNLLIGGSLLLLLGISSILAVNYIPTLEKRVWYAKHSYELLKSGNLESGYSDLGRLISYKIAYKVIKNNPAAGVGAGDIGYEMNKGYERWFPKVPENFRLIPHNQFLIVCLGCGVITLAIFSVWVFWPLLWVRKRKNGFYLFITWLSLTLTLMVEPMLEVQYGVFVYLFFLLMQVHISKPEMSPQP